MNRTSVEQHLSLLMRQWLHEQGLTANFTAYVDNGPMQDELMRRLCRLMDTPIPDYLVEH